MDPFSSPSVRLARQRGAATQHACRLSPAEKRVPTRPDALARRTHFRQLIRGEFAKLGQLSWPCDRRSATKIELSTSRPAVIFQTRGARVLVEICFARAGCSKNPKIRFPRKLMREINETWFIKVPDARLPWKKLRRAHLAALFCSTREINPLNRL